MNDEQRTLLAAYVDGELDAVNRQSARRLVDRDPEARAYLESLEHLNDRLKAAFAPVANQPAPEALLKAIQRPAPRHRHYLPLALAASVALVVVLLVRQESVDTQVQDRLAMIQEQVLELRQQTLENVPSGTSASWVGPSGKARVEVTPVKTYRTADNGFCREFEERIEDAAGVEIRRGIACRTGKAVWPEQSSYAMPDEATDPAVHY